MTTIAIERDGKIVQVDSFEDGALFEHTEYDENGKSTSVTRFDKEGNVVAQQAFESSSETPNSSTVSQESEQVGEQTALTKGAKWEQTGEPEKMKWRTKKHKDSHDITWYLGGKRYGSTTAERDLLRVLADEYGNLNAVWNAYEQNQIMLSSNEAAILKKLIETNTTRAELQQGDLFLERENPAFKKATERTVEQLKKVAPVEIATEEQARAMGAFGFSTTKEEFKARAQAAKEQAGIVAYGLNGQELPITQVEKHSFTGNLKNARQEAKSWAENNFVGKEYDMPEGGGKYIITKRAIGKYIDKTAVEKSENPGVHLSALVKLPEIISNSVDAEIHPDYNRGEDGVRRRENGIGNEDMLVHRLYGAIEIDGKVYRVKTTMHEFLNGNDANSPHSYEVTQIELIEDSTVAPTNETHNPLNRSTNSISATKLLNGVEKSYDKGKKLLDESKGTPEMMTVYHGSGAKFDRFDHSFMGTGEGAQAFGWGTYVTEVEGIGRSYAERAREYYEVPEDGKIKISSNKLDTPLIFDIYEANGYTFDSQREPDFNKLANKMLDEGLASDWLEARVMAFREMLEWKYGEWIGYSFEVEGMSAYFDVSPDDGGLSIRINASRNLYTVEIPEDNGGNYLHWEDVVPKKIETAVKERLLERLSEGQGEAYKTDLKQELDDVFKYSDFDGNSLYNNISAYLGGDKQASLFLLDMGFVGISYPAEATTGGRADKAKNYVIFNESDARITDRVEFFRTANGTVYGWAVNGKVYLTPDGINPNTPVHEYTHLWASVMEKNNPEEWAKIVEGLKASPMWNEVLADEGYRDIWNNDNRVASEVLSRLAGRENYRREMERAQREIDNVTNPIEAAERITFRESVKQAMQRFWDNVKRLFQKITGKAGEGSWNDFAEMPLRDFWAGVKPEATGSPLDKMFIGEQGAANLDKAQEGDVLYRTSEEIEIPRLTKKKVEEIFGGIWIDDKQEFAKFTAAINNYAFEEDGEGIAYTDNYFYAYYLNIDGQAIPYASVYLNEKDSQDVVNQINQDIKDGKQRRVRDYIDRANEVARNIQSKNDAVVGIDKSTSNTRRNDTLDSNISKKGKYFDSPSLYVKTERTDRGEIDTLFRDWYGSRDYREFREIQEGVSNRQYEKAKEVLQALKTAGHNDFHISRSITDFGVSTYILGNYGTAYEGMKFRISDHGVSSERRILTESFFDNNTLASDIVAEVGARKEQRDRIAIERARLDSEAESKRKTLDEKWERIEHYFDGLEFHRNNRTYQHFDEFASDTSRSNILQKDLGDGAFSYEYTSMPNGYGSKKPSYEFIEAFDEQQAEVVTTRLREGYGPASDSEVTTESDVYAKALGHPRYTGRKMREYVAGQRQKMVERANELAEKLHLDNVEVVTEEGKTTTKGFYRKSTGKITIVIPNHSSVADVEQTLLHEAVAHYGLRQLFGESFDTFLDNVYYNASEEVRAEIDRLAMEKYDGETRTATEEYLASLAENTNFENAERSSWWQKIKRFFVDMLANAGVKLDAPLADNELRYILWRSYENLAEPGRYRSIIGEAADIAKQYDLGVGNVAIKREQSTSSLDAMPSESNFAAGNYAPVQANNNMVAERDVFNREGTPATEEFINASVIASNWGNTHKGAAPCIVIQSAETLRVQLEQAGAAEEDIQDLLSEYEKEPSKRAGAMFVPDSDIVVVIDSTLEGRNLKSVLWHEATHRAIRLFFGEDGNAVQQLYDSMPAEKRKEWEAQFKKKGYKPEEYAEEALCYFVENLYLHNFINDRNSDAISKLTYINSADFVKCVKFVQPLIDFITNGQKGETNRSGTPRGGFLGRNGQKDTGVHLRNAGNESGDTRKGIKARRGTGVNAPGTASALYENAVRRKGGKGYQEKVAITAHKLQEAYQDSMLALDELQKAITAETGNYINGELWPLLRLLLRSKYHTHIMKGTCPNLK